jgi:hypothetical protein
LVTVGAEATRRARDRAAYALENIGRWRKIVSKAIMVETEHVLGRIMNREHHLRKVFAAAFMQGLRHLDEMPNIVQSPRIIKFIGNPSELDEFISSNQKFVARLNDVDRSHVVAAGMLRGQLTHYISSKESMVIAHTFFRSAQV